MVFYYNNILLQQKRGVNNKNSSNNKGRGNNNGFWSFGFRSEVEDKRTGRERERREQTHAHIKEPEHLKETQVKRAKVYIVLVQFYTWTLSCFYIF